MIPNLIFDVGFHEACDTEFYLRKGFRVVAIDANPMLCEKARNRLADHIESGRLHILNFGISENDKVEDFIVNFDKSDWSSFLPSFGHRTGNTEIVPVQCKALDYFLDIFGTPYYLKVDIEGYDYACITALQGRSSLPKFVSVEATVEDFPDRMKSMGYQRFKLINQVWHQRMPQRLPPIEGVFVQQQMTGHHSGPFGDETYGSWLTYEEVMAEWQRVKEQRYAGSYHQRIGCREDDFVGGWWDFHCRLGSPDQTAHAAADANQLQELSARPPVVPALQPTRPPSPSRRPTLAGVLDALEIAHKGQLANLQSDLARSLESLDGMKRQVDALNKEWSRSEGEVAVLRGQAEVSERRIADLLGALEREATDRKAVQQQADEAAAARVSTELKLGELTVRLREAQQQQDDTQTRIAQLQRELQDRELKQARATAARVAWEGRVKELTDGLREAQQQRDAAQATITQLHQQLQDQKTRRYWWRFW